MKVLHKDETGMRYLLSWTHGYISFSNDWTQFLRWNRYRWITFRFFQLEAEYSKFFWNYINVTLVGLGFSLYFQHEVPTEEQRRASKTWKRKFDLEIKTRESSKDLIRRLAASGELARGMLLEARTIVENWDELEELNKKEYDTVVGKE